MRKTNMRKAKFRKANLHGADLRKADLCCADLRKVNLSEANLSGADLRKSRLTKANISQAQMRGADLRKPDTGCPTACNWIALFTYQLDVASDLSLSSELNPASSSSMSSRRRTRPVSMAKPALISRVNISRPMAQMPRLIMISVELGRILTSQQLSSTSGRIAPLHLFDLILPSH